jgi:hypothetical protein
MTITEEATIIIEEMINMEVKANIEILIIIVNLIKLETILKRKNTMDSIEVIINTIKTTITGEEAKMKGWKRS